MPGNVTFLISHNVTCGRHCPFQNGHTLIFIFCFLLFSYHLFLSLSLSFVSSPFFAIINFVNRFPPSLHLYFPFFLLISDPFNLIFLKTFFLFFNKKKVFSCIQQFQFKNSFLDSLDNELLPSFQNN